MTGKESCEDDLSTHTGSSYDSDDDDLVFATLDLKGVDFDDTPSSKTVVDEDDMSWIQLERQVLLYDAHQIPVQNDPSKFLEDKESGLSELVECLNTGRYIDALRGKSASFLFSKSDPKTSTLDPGNISTAIRQKLVAFCTTLERCLEAQMIGVSALNLFLQLNYTGPTLEKNLDSTAEMTTKESILANINPHPLFESYLILSPEPTSSEETKTNHDTDSSSDEKGDGTSKSDEPTFTKAMNKYQNTVLSHLSVDGEWPCQVCETPYFLLLSRIILSTLADPLRKDWTHSVDATESPTTNNENNTTDPILVKREKSDFNSVDMPDSFLANTSKLTLAHLWSARATVAHQRLLQCDEPSLTLWKEAEEMFQKCIDSFCFPMKELNTNKENPKIKGEDEISRYHSHQGMAARIMLEWGLAQHHFDRDGKGKKSFQQAREYSGVKIEVMGAKGKRTKFQTEHKAQMLVRAFSTAPVLDSGENNEKHEEKSSDEVKRDMIKAKEIQHDEEEILLDRVHFEDDQYNVTRGKLQDLDQAILLALCLDVKNDNPIDGLTGEQMGGYLERVLIEHDDWMIYSTGLLERAWLECERTHARERAILQIQALVDQHTNRLTITQSTFKSVEDSAPVQDRLKNLHAIVYPPRWEVMRDLAERYAKLGIVTTAAEMFEELELWDDVVQCYTIAGKASKAEEVVRHRLKIAETPRMWVALGDLTDDISCYEKALELSKGKYATAFIELGKYYFKTGDLQKAFELLQKGLNVKPLTPHIWFLLGTVCMRIDDWDNALHAFCEVVQQEPEEGDAWANIAAVYMHVKDPAKAYPAIIEVSLSILSFFSFL